MLYSRVYSSEFLGWDLAGLGWREVHPKQAKSFRALGPSECIASHVPALCAATIQELVLLPRQIAEKWRNTLRCNIGLEMGRTG